MSKTAPSFDEISFGFDELFFSRTDEAGIIRAGNSVFQRVSVYGWDELLDKPHKVVRHPGTPRAVFYLLWQALKAGEPVGAYVKNRAKDGRHYWVFALASPVAGGYLSVRLRPSTPLFDTIKAEYDAHAELERREQLKPADSAALLIERLQTLGFADYATFMTTALGQEIAARDVELRRPVNIAAFQLSKLRELSSGILSAASTIAEMYARNQHVPLNFRVLAGQLGDAGEAIGVIATNYTLLSEEMRQILDTFVAQANDVRKTIDDGYFLSSIARLQQELVGFFEAETDGDADGRAREMQLLDTQQRAYAEKARDGLAGIARVAASFQDSCRDMRRLASGLEVTRVMSVVECARHRDVEHRTAELLSELNLFQKEVSDSLKRIDTINESIAQGVLAAQAGLAKVA